VGLDRRSRWLARSNVKTRWLDLGRRSTQTNPSWSSKWDCLY